MSEIAWEITSLSELGTFSRGKSKHRPRNDVKLFEGGKYPLVQTGDVKAANLYITKNDSYYNDFGLKQSKLWPAGTLCITIAANIAETAILSYPMCFPDSIVGFNANPEKSSELFVYYFFEYIKKEIQKSASGSIQDNINIDYLSKMRIKVPEKKYQDKIVELLSSIDKKILLNNQINQELEATSRKLSAVSTQHVWMLRQELKFLLRKILTLFNGLKIQLNLSTMLLHPRKWTMFSLTKMIANVRQ